MAIKDRNLKPGTKLAARYHKQSYKCEVLEREGGKLSYRLEDGSEFKSTSAAGMAITGKACNGWAFWSVAAAEPAPETAEVAQAAETHENTAAATEVAHITKEPPAKKRIFRLPNQRGVPESKVRWYCHECGKSFLVAPGDVPDSCPQGHKVT